VTEDCIFCRIVAGEAEASVADEDEVTMAFIDLRQFHPGHTLIVPKQHIADIFALDDATGATLMTAVARVSRAVRKTFRPDGINVWQSNGAPWQEVFHIHFHVLPRWKDDGLLRFTPPSRNRPDRAELDEQAKRISAAMEMTP
jgi:histidine triad (HIT) family protein